MSCCVYCLFGVKKCFLSFQILCHKWCVIGRYDWELSSVQRKASNSQCWRRIRKSAKHGPLDSGFWMFAPAPSSIMYRSLFFQNQGTVRVGEKLRYKTDHDNVVKNSAKLDTGHFPIQIHLSALCIMSFTSFLVLKGQTSTERHTKGSYLWRYQLLGHF